MAFHARIPHLRIEFDGDTTVVCIAGGNVFLDELEVEGMRDQLNGHADEPGGSRLLLEVTNVQHVSSLALGTLITLHKKLVAAGRQLSICNLSPQVLEVFTITRLDRFLDLRPAEPIPKPKGLLFAPRNVDDKHAVLTAIEAAFQRHGYMVWSAEAVETLKELKENSRGRARNEWDEFPRKGV